MTDRAIRVDLVPGSRIPLMASTELYLAVLPLVPVAEGNQMSGSPAKQVMTLFPEKKFATLFFPDQVEGYIQQFQFSAQLYLIGGHVIGYDFQKEVTRDGRLIVKVIQNVE